FSVKDRLDHPRRGVPSFSLSTANAVQLTGVLVLKWETHSHTIYSNRRHRRFDALNTPREMIEAAIRKGLQGMIITDHDSVAGGLAGRKVARGYKDFKVIPGSEVTSGSGHILAIGIEN